MGWLCAPEESGEQEGEREGSEGKEGEKRLTESLSLTSYPTRLSKLTSADQLLQSLR